MSFQHINFSSVPRLSPGTFHVWKLRIETLLGSLKLQSFILEDFERPKDPMQLDKYKTRDCAALNAINLTVDNENLKIITSATTARQAHLALCSHYGDTSVLSTATLFYDLVTLKISAGDNISDHVH